MIKNKYIPENSMVAAHNGDSGNTLSQLHRGFFNDESFQPVPTLLLKDLTRTNADGGQLLELQDIAIYALLRSHAYTKGSCYPSHRRLAELAGNSVSTIRRSLKRLEDAGHIQRKNRGGGKIILLTDVTSNAKIVRREPCPIALPKREICPPEFQEKADNQHEPSIIETEFDSGILQRQRPQIWDEIPPSINEEDPF